MLNLRIKALGVMVVALLLITGATYAVANRIVVGGFESLERDEARQNLERTEQALRVETNRLNATAADWSTWDDTYAFVQDGNSDFIEANLYDATLVNLRLDMMMFLDADGEIVHTQAVDVEGSGVQLDNDTAGALSSSAELFDFESVNDSKTGIVMTAAGGLVVASRPIITSAGEGPIVGSLLVARWVDNRLLTELREVTKLEIVLSPASPAGGLAPGEQAVTNIDSNTLLSKSVIADVSGAPALTVQVTMPRSIVEEGRGTLRYLLISLLALGIAFTVLIIVMLELTVLRPVARLSAFVASVGTRLNSRATATGSDEIGHLGRSINGMLDEIEHYSSALTVEQERVQELNRSLELKVAERTADLELANSELRDRNRQLVASMKRASTDGLTGLKNHRSFQEAIRAAAEQPLADGELAVFMADIDRFKHVNDEHGHQVGDRILTDVGSVFRAVLGEQAVFRYGGDEFAMMTRVTSRAHAEEVAETVRQRVMTECADPPVTVSIGVALYSEATSPEELVYHADAAMYAAKAAGKNRVRVWTHGAAALPAADAIGR
jgi:diguanylate cyclase (GGDEF)-like protein